MATAARARQYQRRKRHWRKGREKEAATDVSPLSCSNVKQDDGANISRHQESCWKQSLTRHSSPFVLPQLVETCCSVTACPSPPYRQVHRTVRCQRSESVRLTEVMKPEPDPLLSSGLLCSCLLMLHHLLHVQPERSKVIFTSPRLFTFLEAFGN